MHSVYLNILVNTEICIPLSDKMDLFEDKLRDVNR